MKGNMIQQAAEFPLQSLIDDLLFVVFEQVCPIDLGSIRR
jgi:hypothetical protein